MAKHTPGPWEQTLDGYNPDVPSLAQRVLIDSTQTATGPIARIELAGIENVTLEEAAANAALIVSAPELYRELDTVLSDCIEITPHGYAIYRVKLDDVERAKAALAKAGGS
jgi:hypothetical protein